MRAKLVAMGAVLFLGAAALTMRAAEPEWSPANLNKACDRACLVAIMDRYMDALYKHDPKAVPTLAKDYRMTENTGVMEVGEGVLWRNRLQPTPFKIYIVDPVSGQVAQQGRLQVTGGRGGPSDRLFVVRLKVDRGEIQEIEQLWASGINAAALPLLTTPPPILTTDVPPAETISRDAMLRVASSYFDALEGDNGKIAAFAPDCVRNENGYQTVDNPPPGGRNMPGPNMPTDPEALRFSMLSCEQQISEKTFAYMKHIRPRRVLILDEQKQIVGTFPLFVHDGTRRGAPPDAPPGMLQNLVTMETFGVRGGQIHNVTVMPFVTIPYGLGNGWTPGSGR
ncbi:MAG: hypothetical protein JWO19_5084 [Bryobacterales bacterium]|nr:hypothetical protein [Bryobacterales bacterium]